MSTMTSEPKTPVSPEPSSDDRPENQRVGREQATADAKTLLRRRRDGVLGTLSAKAEGAPFGSVAPYALDRTGAPLIYIAGIAEHTRNLRADPRASLLVFDPPVGEEDIQTHARICVMGVAAPVPDDEKADAWARYAARLPAAAGYRRTHDFSLWRISTTRIRWIGGFGEIFWLHAEDFIIDPAQDVLQETARGTIDHMNEDHRDAIEDFFEAGWGHRPAEARMVGVDAFGMDFDSAEGRLRVDFETPVTLDSLRPEVIATLKRHRARIAGR